jgi:hypothetical protein
MLETSRTINHVNAELKTSVSEMSFVSFIRIDAKEDFNTFIIVSLLYFVIYGTKNTDR